MVLTASQRRTSRKNRPPDKLFHDRLRDRDRKRIKRKEMKTPDRRTESQKAIARRRNQKFGLKAMGKVKAKEEGDSHEEAKPINFDIMDVLGKDTGLLPVTTAEAETMDPFRRRLLIPLVTLSPFISKTDPKKREEREPTETIDTIVPNHKIVIKKRNTKVMPNYVDVTGIKPPESYLKDGVRVPCEPIEPYKGVTIKEALDNLLEDIRKERRARVGSPELPDFMK